MRYEKIFTRHVYLYKFCNMETPIKLMAHIKNILKNIIKYYINKNKNKTKYIMRLN